MERLEIHTKRLRIRNLKLSDLKDFHFYRSNPEVVKFQGFDVKNLEECREFIRTQMHQLFGKPMEWVQYGIEKLENNKLIGDCAIKISSNDEGTASIGITLSPKEQNKGYAKEVMLGILHFLFEQQNVHRVVETLITNNISSEKLVLSIGFRKEGIFLESSFVEDKWIDSLQYAMLKKEWKKLKHY